MFVLLPLVLAAVYFGLVASDRYVSESRFVIKSPGQRPAQLSTLANLIQTTGLSAGQEQANEVIEYLRSRDALANLNKSVGFEEAFSARDVDFISRFPGPFEENSFEDLFDYYQNVVSARVEPETGIVSLRVWGFSAKNARDINQHLLERSEALVNQLNATSESKSIAEAERRVDLAEIRVRRARAELREFRNEESILDPSQQAIGVLEVTNRLITEQAVARAQLEQMELVAPQNPSIPTIRARIATLGNQIELQSGRAVGTRDGIASKLGEYENRAAEQEFAQQMLAAANASLEQARSEAQRQQFYLQRVVEPNLPDAAQLPNRLTQILTAAGVLLCLYLIGWMLIVGILEHSPDD